VRKKLIADHVYAGHAFMNAPTGYFLATRGAIAICPGAILPGPELDSRTTVHLIEGDDGAWLRKLSHDNLGEVREESY
jgi:hypothetical protein